ncbi:FAD binding domain-containing protein [Purpureocillium lilacinum]|uniref:FAD binding domain-containing protein n=2 Tax=Purpureocillium lilacinum TaxID=33203 RepID=A0A179GCM0_PURLI|nr:FAD binding domain-containing protein [Purpureocillium lilacinum]
MTPSPFRVIVVGGGPVGMTAAHALSRANLDFIVLERRAKMVEDAGSNLVLLPIGLRVLGQLGLLPKIESVSSPMSRFRRMDHNGRDLGDTLWFTYFKENHGAYPRVISRHDLMQTLHDGLPAEAKAKLLPGKKVIDVSSGPDGVSVTCADGTSYTGTVIVGADGAHSRVRDLMRTAALQAPPTTENKINEAEPFLTTYRAMWLFAGEGTSVIGVYERMEKPTREGVRYNQADEEKFIERWGHLPIIEGGLTIKEAYTNRTQAGMVNLEEGVVDHWSWDRIVLVGDAAHKFTPSTGAGCNNGIVDVVALSNEMYHAFKAVRASDPEAFPTKEQVFAAFEGYQLARFETVKAGLAGASQATGAATWADTTHKFVDRHILSKQSLQKFFANRNAPALARTPVFEYVEGEEQMVGKFPWAHPIKPASS